MNVRECMTRQVQLTDPDETIREAAQTMAECDAGALPVGKDDRLVGMITDRDIAIRAIASGKGPEAKVRDVMTQEIKYCFEDQPIEEVLENMARLRIRRLPVIDRNKRLVGILSLSDAAAHGQDSVIGKTLGAIAQPGGPHSHQVH